MAKSWEKQRLLDPHQEAVGVISESIVGPNPAALLTLLALGAVTILAPWRARGSAPAGTDSPMWDPEKEVQPADPRCPRCAACSNRFGCQG